MDQQAWSWLCKFASLGDSCTKAIPGDCHKAINSYGYAVPIQMQYRPQGSQGKNPVYKNSQDMCSDTSNWMASLAGSVFKTVEDHLKI